MGWKNGGGKEYNKKVEEKLIKETCHGLKKKGREFEERTEHERRIKKRHYIKAKNIHTSL